MDSVLEQLHAAVASRAYVCVARDAIAARRICGFALAADDHLLLMHEVPDFDPDGFTIVRLRDVTAVRDGPNERFTARVMEAEGIFAAQPAPAVDLSSWRTAFAALAGGPWPLALVENEAPDGGDVWVGRVLAAGDDAAAFRYVSPLGVWDEPEEIPYGEVTLVRFGDRYTTVLARHTDPPAQGNGAGP